MSCKNENNDRFIFFLHNRFLENHDLNDLHPEYGKVEYNKILNEFKTNGFKVISAKREGNTDVKKYANQVVSRIDSLISTGVNAKNITIVGTSKGGYIAQYISTYANNPKLNFVFIGCYRDQDLINFPDINFCGNILTIREKSDSLGVSAIKRKESSSCMIKHFKELELNTNLKHGFLFKSLDEWIQPTIKWAKGNYELK